MPVPGDGRYEWKGSLSADQLPSVYNPPEGWFASANEMNLPAGYPVAERKVGFEWSDPTRITRIKQVLAANGHVTLADSMNLQMDATSPEACRLKALLAPLSSDDPDAAAGLALLKGWDCRESVESAAAAFYEDWAVNHLSPALVAAATPAAARSLIPTASLDAVITYLEGPDATGRPRRGAALQPRGLETCAASWAQTRPAGAGGRCTRRPSSRPPRRWPASVSLAQMAVGPLEVRGRPRRMASRRVTDYGQSPASVRLDMDVGD